jgi:ABC-type transporter lipoprotein component MlaA
MTMVETGDSESSSVANLSHLSLSDILIRQLFHTESLFASQILIITVYLLQYSYWSFGPILNIGLSTIGKAIFIPIYNYLSRPTPIRAADADVYSYSDATSTEEAPSLAQMSQTVVSSEEDRKSSRATNKDISQLRNKGYNRYRFVSNAFIRRHKLREVDTDNEYDDNGKSEIDDEKEDNDEDGKEEIEI